MELEHVQVGSHDPYRRQATFEVLMLLTTGEFVNLRRIIEDKYHCRIYGEEPSYLKDIENLGFGEREDLDCHLLKLLNIFEAVAIFVRNKMVDEDALIEYLGVICTQYASWAAPFIEKHRSEAHPRTWLRFTELAAKWVGEIDRRDNEVLPVVPQQI